MTRDFLFEHAIEEMRREGEGVSPACKICSGATRLYDVVDFNKECQEDSYPAGLRNVPVLYRICGECGFIFTNFFDAFTGEQWREFVYNEDYLRVDPEYVEVRPRSNARQIASFLTGKKAGTIGLDFGGGNGLTVSLLRGRGWKFDSYDPYGFTDLGADRVGRYNFCSAMEVFEHTPDPVGSLRSILEKTTDQALIILIGTGINDSAATPRLRLSWQYAAPRNGHISLYSRESLTRLAAKFDLRCTSFLQGTHLLTRGIGDARARAMLLRGKLIGKLRARLGA